MRILVAHNQYQQHGGEDVVSHSEAELLKRKGEEVFYYKRSNEEIKNLNYISQLNILSRMHFSQASYREARKMIGSFKPDIVHVYNTFFMITPSFYQACIDENVPVVQSLYNYRLVCANALLLRNGKFCDDCLSQSRWKSVVHRCYRKSSLLTALLVKMINYHWEKKTWTRLVDRYITATEFSKQIFVRAGIEAEKIVVKPHFMPYNPQVSQHSENYVLYVGRISVEKGVEVMVRAWAKVNNLKLKIMGEGPLLNSLKEMVERDNIKNVELLGFQPQDVYEKLLQNAKMLIVPSINNDNFPRVIIEAYAYGVPVIGSSLDGIKEYIKEKMTGLTFKVGDAEDLERKINWMLVNAKECVKMRTGARKEYEENYTADKNYEALKCIYQDVIQYKKVK